MTKATFYTATTLDGYIADENDSLEWLFVQDNDGDGPLNYDDFIAGIGAIVMGRTTYEWIGAHNQKTGEKWAYSQPIWVFTHDDLEPLADNVSFVSGKPD